MEYTQLTDDQRAHMRGVIGVEKLEDLLVDIPESVRLRRPLAVPPPLSEPELLSQLDELACSNTATHKTCFLGGGAYDHFVPTVVNALAGNSEFVTAYTPYQAEASQGTLQVFYEFQTLVCELTGMDVANASLYEGGSAVAEAVMMCASISGKREVILSGGIHPHYRQIVATYLTQLPLKLHTVELGSDGRTDLARVSELMNGDTACVVTQTPNFFGCIEQMDKLGEMARAAGVMQVACVDPISLAVLKRPGAFDVDVVVAEGQPLGVPMSYGGPWLGLMATKKKYMRKMPGRLVGRTVDADGKPAYTLALATREQHIRREKATSNICTNQGLLAYRAAIYMAAVGRRGLRQVADLCLSKAHYAAQQIAAIDGYELAFPDTPFFKEFLVRSTKRPAAKVLQVSAAAGLLIGPSADHASLRDQFPVDKAVLHDCFMVAVTEKRTKAQIDKLVAVLKDL